MKSAVMLERAHGRIDYALRFPSGTSKVVSD
uniref:Uncharacterized protein n=1 Tax=Microviridae sp. ctb4Q28 TaxID=2825002 RepID=A0A8S5UXS0_9VIRU|nr:MAG TPA: hypothetical protein [Microviridae sp. ctb4Q28]